MRSILKRTFRKKILFLISAVLLIFLPMLIFGRDMGIPEAKAWTFPVIGNRAAVWIMAQMHILFAAFILGTPIFVVLIEFIGYLKKDEKFERLAHEIVKLVAMAYSFTALFGGGLLIILIILYPNLTTFLFSIYSPVMLIYIGLFLLETTFMYLYTYSWDAMSKGRLKIWHIIIGVILNVVGTLSMASMNSMAAFMLTPPKNFPDSTLWEIINNFTWMPLNFHRFIANITFGGYVVCIVSAYLYLSSKTEKDRAYYDWQGFIANLIGVGAMLPIPIMGYIYANELYAYGAEIGVYMMSDRLSMHFELQAVVVGLLFLASNYYIWLSMKRIEGAEKYRFIIKIGFVLTFMSWCIWFAPRHFFATMIAEPGMISEGMELPSHLGFLALMPAKNTAAIVMVLVVIINYILYFRALSKGKVRWGEIDPVSQYVLLFLGYLDVWLMNLMGPVRELARKDYHVYKVVKDRTAESFAPSIDYTVLLTTIITLAFFALLTGMIFTVFKFKKAD